MGQMYAKTKACIFNVSRISLRCIQATNIFFLADEVHLGER